MAELNHERDTRGIRRYLGTANWRSRSLAARLPRQRSPGDAAGGRRRAGQPARCPPAPDGTALRSRRRTRGGAPRAPPLLERPAPLLRWPDAPHRRRARLPADPRSPPRPRDHRASLDQRRRRGGDGNEHPGRAPAGAEPGDGHPHGHRRSPRHPRRQRPVRHLPDRRPAGGGRGGSRRGAAVHRPHPAARHPRLARRRLRAQSHPDGAGRGIDPAPHHRPRCRRYHHDHLAGGGPQRLHRRGCHPRRPRRAGSRPRVRSRGAARRPPGRLGRPLAGRYLVEGDPEVQRFVRAGLFALLCSIRADVPASIAPMGLSSLGYNGHIFWDADTWMFPPCCCCTRIWRAACSPIGRSGSAPPRERARGRGLRGRDVPLGERHRRRRRRRRAPSPAPASRSTTSPPAWPWPSGNTTWLRATGTGWRNDAWPVLEAAATFWVSRVTRHRAAATASST